MKFPCGELLDEEDHGIAEGDEIDLAFGRETLHRDSHGFIQSDCCLVSLSLL
jgi:hypothetical protein